MGAEWPIFEAADDTRPEYSHTQKAPLCLLVYALAVVFLALGYLPIDRQQWSRQNLREGANPSIQYKISLAQ